MEEKAKERNDKLKMKGKYEEWRRLQMSFKLSRRKWKFWQDSWPRMREWDFGHS